MFQRLVTGFGKGFLLGGLLALVAIRGLGMTVFVTSPAAYLAAAVAGVLAGLFAGRPLWAREARIEAGLKAVAGAALGAGVLFAIRRWLPFEVDLSAWQAGRGAIGSLPAVSLPFVSVVLAILFDLDNTGDKSLPPKTRVAGQTGERSASEQALDDDADQTAARRDQSRR